MPVKTTTKSGGKKTDTAKSQKPLVKNTTFNPDRIPARLFLGIICLGMFLVHVVVMFRPSGALPLLYKSIMMGLFGEVGFYILLFVLPYLFWVLNLMKNGKATMRALSIIAFTLVCGASLQLLMPETLYGSFFNAITELYKGGNNGTTAGVICGGLGILFHKVFGEILSFVVLLILGAVFLLLTMEITLPGLYHAIQNRPRDTEPEEKEYVPRDHAAELVNGIVNSKNAIRRRLRDRAEDEAYEYYDEDEEVDVPPLPGTRFVKGLINGLQERKFFDIDSEAAPEQPRIPAQSSNKRDNVMRQMEEETDTPLGRTRQETEDAMEEVFVPEPAAQEVPAEPVTEAPKKTKKKAETDHSAVAAELEQAKAVVKAPYCFPPINLLKMPPRNGVSGTEEMKENSRRLNETLESFNIAAHIVNVTRGPSVTRYEVELEKGVKLSKLTNCADDIALSLGASGVRIAAIPGKISVVGIEVPNRAVTMVSLREVIDSNEFNSSKGLSTFAVGKDIGGTCIIGNIAKMPHMLIAGTTGSGKSVCMNSIIISLLYKAAPEDVKLIMVDPKMVELANYNGIPHLMIPVVTDPKKAAGALQWAVTEMMRRYKTMSDAGVRDLESYNSIVAAEGGEKVPQLIVIIDELADLMMVAAKEVEDSICRIAQMGRASGVHLVIATQRPSADVITGLMKANIPSRIAFSVASAMESRIILDTQGAEKLVGKGDMLFAPIGAGKPLRVQGCFVTDAEVLAVTSYVKENYIADYDQSVLEDIEKKAQQTGKKPAASVSDPEPTADELEGDELLPQAVDVVLETGQASVSMLQRRLKLGYARAARIVDEMEEKGIVGPFQGSKPRNILITKEQWDSMKGSGNVQLSMDDLDDGPVPEDLPF